VSLRDFVPLDLPHANAGLDGVPIGLDCQECGTPITVSYIAHGRSADELVSDPMLDLVKAAGRALFKNHAPLCSNCAPPAPLRRPFRIGANDSTYKPGGFTA
jgi:hypothetical protein